MNADLKLEAMKEGGQGLGRILQELLGMSQPGVSLLDIEAVAAKRIQDYGGTPSFQTVKGYQWATCLCVNEEVVHGIPTGRTLQEGDIFTIDIGMLYKGYHTDTAWTKIVKGTPTLSLRGAPRNGATKQSPKIATLTPFARNDKEQFLKTGEDALWKAIDQARPGNRVGHISQTIQSIVEGAGYSIVKTLVGHGVGLELHEAPQIPGYLKGPVEATPLLESGQTIAIEVIYAKGSGEIVYENDDGWTLSTRDRSLTSVFEHTIAVTAAGPLVLTKRED